VITKMKRGKAAGLDGITAEHLQYSHPLLVCVLSKLFKGIVKLGHVPASFGQSYTVPLLKTGSSAYGKSVTVNDFRGISIRPVISKVFEHCILDIIVICLHLVIINLDSKTVWLCSSYLCFQMCD